MEKDIETFAAAAFSFVLGYATIILDGRSRGKMNPDAPDIVRLKTAIGELQHLRRLWNGADY